MGRGYAQDWPKNFLSKTAYCARTKAAGIMVDGSTTNNARWNLSDALSFRTLPHFRLPSDPTVTAEQRDAQPLVDVAYSGEAELLSTLRITSAAGIVRVSFNDKEDAEPSIHKPSAELLFTEQELEERFDRASPLSVHVLGFNGREVSVKDVWKMLAVQAYVRIPGSDVRLFRRSVYSDERESSDRQYYEWAQLLREKGPDGNVHRATSIDLRVGCIWDGGIVKYEDGHVSHWGPMRLGRHEHVFGGHASEEIVLPPNVNIKRVDINRGGQGATNMEGIRMHLTNRTSAGELNSGNNIIKLQAAAQEVIVGFYGKSDTDGFRGVVEFGIITAPKAVGLEGLPDAVFDLRELRNENKIINGVDGDEVMEDAATEDGDSSGSGEDDSDGHSDSEGE